MADYSVVMWGERNTPEGFATYKKKIKVATDHFLALSNALGFEGKGVDVSLYELDGGESDVDFYGYNLLSTYSKWLVEFTLRDEPGIHLEVEDFPGMDYYKLVDVTTSEVLYEGYGEKWVAEIRKNGLAMFDSMGLTRDGNALGYVTDTHVLYEYVVPFDTDMENI